MISDRGEGRGERERGDEEMREANIILAVA